MKKKNDSMKRTRWIQELLLPVSSRGIGSGKWMKCMGNFGLRLPGRFLAFSRIRMR